MWSYIDVEYELEPHTEPFLWSRGTALMLLVLVGQL